MRVALHVGQLLQRTPGGIGRYIQELVLVLPATGVEVETFAAGPVPAHLRGALPHHSDLGRPVRGLRYELWHRLRRPALRLESRVDIVHAPSLAIPPARRRPLVVTVHDVAFLHYPEHFTRRGVAFHRRGLAVARAEAAAVIAVSEHGRSELIAEGFEPARVHVVPHGVRIPETPNEEAVDRCFRELGLSQPFVLFVGTIEPRKGAPFLADAVRAVRSEHPELQLVLAGPRGWGDVDGLEEPWIRELGVVDDMVLDALYRRAALCALPSLYEGFGFPVLEAMARGCPVLAADTTSLPETVGDAAILLPAAEVDAWQDAIELVLDDPAHADAMTERGHARAAECTWERCARGHLEVYRAVTGR